MRAFRGRNRVVLLLAIAAGGAVAATIAGLSSFWITTASYSVTPTPSRLYGRPLVLRVGDAAAPAELVARLADHGYARVAVESDLRSGTFLEAAPGDLLVARRPDPRDAAADSGSADRVRVRIDRDRIVRLVAGGGLREVVELDPPLLWTYFDSHRREHRPVAYHQLPDDLVHAVLAAEDSSYFRHGGISSTAMLRALWVNLRAGEVRQGASTITQQLARRLYLTRERTVARKLRETVLATLLEARYSKRRLLTAYLNEIYFGRLGGAELVGAGAAAHAWFGKSPRQLELHEAALLAGAIRSPGRYSPVAHPEAALARRNRVLAQMEAAGWITAERHRAAAAEPLALSLHPVPERGEHGWFAAVAGREAARRFGAARLEIQGLTLLSTLDVTDQRAAVASFEALAELDEKSRRSVTGQELQAALVSLDPRDGAIRAWVGGRDFAKSEFDRAGSARRQAGSALKPLVLAAALESGRTLADRIEDGPVVVRTASGDWRPKNFDGRFQGEVTARQTIEQSLNVPAVRLAVDAGLERVAATVERFGFAAQAPHPALALGAVDVAPVELAAVYAAFASGGARPVPFALERVLDARRTPIDGAPVPRPSPVLDLQIAYLVDSTLRGALAHGTAAGVRRAGLDDGALAGKTGTSDDQRDSWFAGYARERVAVVWVGFDDNSPTRLPGSRGALPVWARFMMAVRPAGGYRGLSLPEGIVTAKIDPESGLLATADCPESREELFAAARAPIEFCPWRHDGTDGLTLAVYGESWVSPPGESAYAIAGMPEAVIELGGAEDGRGEPRIVIRRVPRPAPPPPLPVPPRPPVAADAEGARGGAGN